MWVEAGLNKSIMNKKEKEKSHWSESWIDEIKGILSKENIVVCKPKSKEKKITSNRTMMEHTREYVKENQMKDQVLELLNHVRLHKQVFLPCELVGRSRKECSEVNKVENIQS